MTRRGGECRVKEKNINGMNDDCVERFEGKVQVQHKRASLPVRSIKHGVRAQSMYQTRHVPTCMVLPSSCCQVERHAVHLEPILDFGREKKIDFTARLQGDVDGQLFLPISNFFSHPPRTKT